MRRTESESYEDDIESADTSADSESMGLPIPQGYLLPSPQNHHRSPQSAGETTREERRLVMLAKHPQFSEADVAQAIRKPTKKTRKKKALAAVPLDSNSTGARNKNQVGQSVDNQNVAYQTYEDEDFDEVWVEHQQQMQEQAAAAQNRRRNKPFFSSFFSSAQNDGLDCGASKQSHSLSSEKTPKISNVDERARDKRIRHELGQLTVQDRMELGCRRLTSTRSGMIILCLLIVLFLALVVVVTAGITSGKDESGDVDKNIATMIPRPWNPEETPSPTAAASAVSPPAELIPTATVPTFKPTSEPTESPTKAPTESPTKEPTDTPTERPTDLPTVAPTKPRITSSPTVSPTDFQAPSAPPSTNLFSSTFSSLQSLQGSEPEQRFGNSVAISDDGKILAVGAPFATVNSNSKAGMVQVYERLDNTWVPRGPALVGRNAQDQLGYAIALSSDGSILVASEPLFKGNAGDRSGNVRAFVYGSSNSYEPLGQELEGEAATNHFGASVALSKDGRRIAAGAPYHDNGGSTRNVSGRVRVFDYDSDSNTWVLLGDPLLGANHLDWFGWKVDLSDDGSVLAVGAPRNLEFGGYVNVYELDQNKWIMLGDTIENSRQPLRYDDNFGHALKLSGTNRIAIGAPRKNVGVINAGMVTVFELDNNDDWKLIGDPITSEEALPQAGQELGLAVDFYGNILVVGVPGRHQVDLFQWDGVEQQWQRYPEPLQGIEGSNFGFSVQYRGSSLVVGSAITDDENAGMVDVYQRS